MVVMSYRESVKQNVERSRENNSSNGRTELEQVEIDTSEGPYVCPEPTTLIKGTFPEEDEGNPIIKFRDFDGDKAEVNAGGYLGLIADDLEAIVDDDDGTGGTFVLDEKDSNNIRVLNTDDEWTDLAEGVGATYEFSAMDTLYKGDVVDELPDGRAILKVSGSAMESVARALDVNGAVSAGMDEETGRVNDGLVEYAYTNDDGDPVDNEGNSVPAYSRFARKVQLRDELYGQDFVLAIDNRADVDDDYDGRPMKFYTVFADLGDGMEPLEYTTGDAYKPAYLMWSFDETAGHLPDQDYEFVQQYQENDLSTDEEDIRAEIEGNLDDLSDDPNVDRMVALIQG